MQETLQALIQGPDDDVDPKARDLFRDVAASLAPQLARIAETLSAPLPESEPPLPAEQAIEELEAGVASGKYIERSEVLRRIGHASAAFRAEIIDGLAKLQELEALHVDSLEIRAFWDDVVDRAVAKLIDLFPERDQCRGKQ
jgi:hypothetical protein